jgi:hypothetical protein
MIPKKNPITITTLAVVVTSSVLNSCAGPESYQQKMARYTPKTIEKNLVPDIKVSEFNFKPVPAKPIEKQRAPSSAPENPNLSEEGKESNATNKKLYFLTLFSQYETLKKYSANFIGPTITICPNFHTGLLRHNEKFANLVNANSGVPKSKKFTYDSKKYADELYLSSRPELLLPLSKSEVTPKVIDVMRGSKDSMNDFAINELVHKALDIHLAKTYSEIRELCEYGATDNYYIYENLVTHIKNNKFEANNKNMNTLLKTTIFSNIALINSITGHDEAPMPGRGIASIKNDNKKNIYATEIMGRLNVNWANQYFDFIKESH